MTQEISNLIAQLDAEKIQLKNLLAIEQYKIAQILENYPQIQKRFQSWLTILQNSKGVDVPLKSVPEKNNSDNSNSTVTSLRSKKKEEDKEGQILAELADGNKDIFAPWNTKEKKGQKND